MTTEIKTYHYPKINVVMGFGLIPLGIAFLWLVAFLMQPSGAKDGNWLSMAMSFIFAIPVIVSILMIVNLTKVNVSVDSEFLTYNSLFRNLKISWEEVKSVKKVYLISGRYGGPPRDLEIQFQNNRKLNLLYFILNTNNENWDEDGMAEFVNNLKAHVGERFVEEA